MSLKEYNDPVNILDQKKGMERLLESPAWLMIVATVQEQVDALQQDILFGPVRGQDDFIILERKKGLLAGMLSLQNTAQTILEGLELDYQLAQQQKENQNETSLDA